MKWSKRGNLKHRTCFFPAVQGRFTFNFLRRHFLASSGRTRHVVDSLVGRKHPSRAPSCPEALTEVLGFGRSFAMTPKPA